MADDDENTPPEAPPEPEPAAQVIGLSGTAVQRPGGRWLAQVDQDGSLVRQDGLLVRVRD